MSIRTIQDIENQKSTPKFETIILICKELNISLDGVIFPEITNTYLSKSVLDFFAHKNDAVSKKYISLCEYIEDFNKTN
jgi:transcriptional regulator with XRE-family HTH domain